MMTPNNVRALLDRYWELDAWRGEAFVTVSRDEGHAYQPRDFRAAEGRADIDRALVRLRQLDEQLWCAVKLVHVIPYPDPRHPDYHCDRHWLAHAIGRLAFSYTARCQMAAHDLGCSYTKVYYRCREAYKHLAAFLDTS